MRRRGGQRTCRPLDRGQNSTRCTSLRRALGIVGDSCQEHGESMQGGHGGEVSPVRSHPSHRTGAARRRQEPSRPASCHLNAPCAFSHVCRCPQRNRRGWGGGRVNSVGPGGRRKRGRRRRRERKMMENTSLNVFKRIPNIAPRRSVNHGRSFSPHRQVKTRASAEANRAEALCPLWLPSGEDGHDCNSEISARGGERNPPVSYPAATSRRCAALKGKMRDVS